MKLSRDMISRLTTGWDEAVGFRVLAAAFGIFVLYLLFRSLRRRKSNFIALASWGMAGGFALAFSAWPQSIVTSIISTPYDMRVRYIMGFISVLVIVITLESIRRFHLQERYALLWLATGTVILLGALFPSMVALLRAGMGMQYVTALVAVAFTFLVLVVFHFSISISSSRSNQARIAQRVAILEEKIRSLEKGGGAGEGAPGGGAGAGTGGEEGPPRDAG
jgi:hypothetical protein